jgi:hypothetical protein
VDDSPCFCDAASGKRRGVPQAFQSVSIIRHIVAKMFLVGPCHDNYNAEEAYLGQPAGKNCADSSMPSERRNRGTLFLTPCQRKKVTQQPCAAAEVRLP